MSTPYDEDCELDCPHCGETTGVDVASIGTGRAVTDCAVCCRPFAVEVTEVEGEFTIRVTMES